LSGLGSRGGKLQIGCAKAACEAPNFVAFQHISTLFFETFDEILGDLFLGLEPKCGSKTVISSNGRSTAGCFSNFSLIGDDLAPCCFQNPIQHYDYYPIAIFVMHPCAFLYFPHI
jgi:hypothetical protein